jgi:hypothetical protein
VGKALAIKAQVVGSTKLMLVVSLYAQASDAAQQEEEEEHADPNLRKGDYQHKEKGVA